MVARTRTYRGDLLVMFSRDGEADDARVVPNPERAAVNAIMMIALRGELIAGDRISVREDDGGNDAQ
jgi:hypothetical protein